MPRAAFDGASVEDRRRLLAQVAEMDANYPSDAQGRSGLSAYVAHARELLADSAADKNPFEGYAVEVPEGERMDIGSEAFRAEERRGIAVAQDTVFVLVAGGLGERSGMAGSRWSSRRRSGASFLQTYMARSRHAGIATSGAVPLVIMTRGYVEKTTPSSRRRLLRPRRSRCIIKQANVPALNDNAGASVMAGDFACDAARHGEHTRSTRRGSARLCQGRKYLAFFQDTNVLAFKAIPRRSASRCAATSR